MMKILVCFLRLAIPALHTSRPPIEHYIVWQEAMPVELAKQTCILRGNILNNNQPKHRTLGCNFFNCWHCVIKCNLFSCRPWWKVIWTLKQKKQVRGTNKVAEMIRINKMTSLRRDLLFRQAARKAKERRLLKKRKWHINKRGRVWLVLVEIEKNHGCGNTCTLSLESQLLPLAKFVKCKELSLACLGTTRQLGIWLIT